jgi:hypothetical protein
MEKEQKTKRLVEKLHEAGLSGKYGEKGKLSDVEVWVRDGFRCVYCQANLLEDRIRMATAQLDHILPKKSYGSYEENRRFCEIMEASDIVVLRIGTTDIFGVGIVVGDYEWRDKFCDVDGWSLQHVRRVRWLWKYQDDPMRFDRYTLRFGDAVQVMDSDVVEKWLTKLDIKEKALKRPIRNLPTFSSNVDRSLVDEEDFN